MKPANIRRRRSAPSESLPPTCPFDGATLGPLGVCPTGNGYPFFTWAQHPQTGERYKRVMPCPFACPICSSPLDWDGGCLRCHGSRSGESADWTFPGDCYEVTSPVSHWVKTISGPRPCLTEAEWAETMRHLRGMFRHDRLPA